MSSPIILSLSTIFALLGIVLTSIAFSTNNWTEYTVNRNEVFRQMGQNASLRQKLTPIVNRTNVYYDRSVGLFRICFPNGVPTDSGSFKSALNTHCVTLKDYQIPVDEKETSTWNDDQWTRMHLMRTMVCFYGLGLIFLFMMLFTGVCGCWRRHANLILTTGILLLFATLFLAAAMAVWHGVDYLSREVIDVWPYERSWNPLLRSITSINYGWSYVIAWVGIALVLVSSLLMLAGYRSMKEEEADELDKKAAPYMMTNYYDQKNAGAVVPYGYGGAGAAGYPVGTYAGAYPPAYYGYGMYGGGYTNGYMTYSR